jgi:hypothetical protein
MNFDTDVNEHQDNIKQTIQKLQTSQLFDKSIVKDLHLFFFYVINQKLETFKRIDLTINDSLLTKNELLSNILKNKKEDGRKFNITGIYKYHFNENCIEEISIGYKFMEPRNDKERELKNNFDKLRKDKFKNVPLYTVGPSNTKLELQKLRLLDGTKEEAIEMIRKIFK